MIHPIKTRWLMFRMWLGWDPAARAACRRLTAFHAELEKAKIRQKAVAHEVRVQLGLVESGVVAKSGDRALISPAHFNRDEGEIVMVGGVTDTEGTETFNLPKRAAPVEKSLTDITADGIEVQVYDPTDTETAEIMRQFEMGDATQHERDAIFVQVDATPPPVVEWEGDAPDPFEGVKNLG